MGNKIREKYQETNFNQVIIRSAFFWGGDISSKIFFHTEMHTQKNDGKAQKLLPTFPELNLVFKLQEDVPGRICISRASPYSSLVFSVTYLNHIWDHLGQRDILAGKVSVMTRGCNNLTPPPIRNNIHTPALKLSIHCACMYW